MKTILLAFVLGSFSSAAVAIAQDPATSPMQQAAQASQQAMQQVAQQAALFNQQLSQSSRLAMQQASQFNQQVMDAARQSSLEQQIAGLQAARQRRHRCLNAPPLDAEPTIDNDNLPFFSVKPGRVKAGTTVRIKWRASQYDTVYYSTDGWTPTIISTLYTGSIPINQTTHFQAFAIGPGNVRSAIVRADYRVDRAGSAPPIEQSVQINGGLLRAGTSLRLAAGSTVSSAFARVGDKAPLVLDQDVKSGGRVVAAKGTPVDAVFTYADPAAGADAGDLVFEVHSLNIQGKKIPLLGAEFLEGQTHQQAIIQPGMPVIATVATDTPLKP
jgi:hypothetical protein